MKYKLGIYGSAAGDLQAAMPIALKLGRVLQDYADTFILITGACSGLPDTIISEALPSGIEIWGFSSSFDLNSQKKQFPTIDTSVYKKIIYVPRSFTFENNERVRMKYRNVISTANCDAAIIVSGRWGTLNEFTNLIDFQKIVGVLNNSGGIADELASLSNKISKAGQGPIIFDDDPKQLIEPEFPNPLVFSGPQQITQGTFQDTNSL